LEYSAPHLLQRSDEWLGRQLIYVWDHFFRDIPQVNHVSIEFAKRWKTRLGVIRLSEDGKETYIGVNNLLRNVQVPYAVCLITIAHEIVHYAHGFGSPLPRKHRHPHHGNIVSRELISRGLGRELEKHDQWTEAHWQSFYRSQLAAASVQPRASGFARSRLEDSVANSVG
jgi:hypothetical protein